MPRSPPPRRGAFGAGRSIPGPCSCHRGRASVRAGDRPPSRPGRSDPEAGGAGRVAGGASVPVARRPGHWRRIRLRRTPCRSPTMNSSPTRHSRNQAPVTNLRARASRPQRAGGAGFSGIPTLVYYKTCGCRDGAPPKAVASCRRRIFRTRTSPPALLSGGPPAHLRAGRPCPKRHAAPRGLAAPTQPPVDERFFVTLLRISRVKVYIPRGSPAARR